MEKTKPLIRPDPDVVRIYGERITTAEAGRILCINPETVRYLMDTGELHIGKIIRNKKRNTYVIYRHLCEQALQMMGSTGG